MDWLEADPMPLVTRLLKLDETESFCHKSFDSMPDHISLYNIPLEALLAFSINIMHFHHSSIQYCTIHSSHINSIKLFGNSCLHRIPTSIPLTHPQPPSPIKKEKKRNVMKQKEI
jgi:ribulose-5-phosphate 4-epimerase/fuculose-1-phosphate aldolase